MSSLLPALVYKHTITFKVESAGLPWVEAGEAGGGLISHSCAGQALLLGLCCWQIHLPALRLHLLVPGRHKPISRCSPLDMPLWRCPVGDGPATSFPPDSRGYLEPSLCVTGFRAAAGPRALLVLYKSLSTYRDQQAHLRVTQPTTMTVQARI